VDGSIWLLVGAAAVVRRLPVSVSGLSRCLRLLVERRLLLLLLVVVLSW